MCTTDLCVDVLSLCVLKSVYLCCDRGEEWWDAAQAYCHVEQRGYDTVQTTKVRQIRQRHTYVALRWQGTSHSIVTYKIYP